MLPYIDWSRLSVVRWLLKPKVLISKTRVPHQHHQPRRLRARQASGSLSPPWVEAGKPLVSSFNQINKPYKVGPELIVVHGVISPPKNGRKSVGNWGETTSISLKVQARTKLSGLVISRHTWKKTHVDGFGGKTTVKVYQDEYIETPRIYWTGINPG